MSRRVYLHIGAPKTGTTYLQDRLTLNAKSLTDNGVHFPSRSPLVSPSLFHFRAALDLPFEDQVEAVGRQALPKDAGAPRMPFLLEQMRDRVELGRGQIREQGEPGEAVGVDHDQTECRT